MECPFCGSENLGASLDDCGAQCWCNDCSRIWIPTEEDLDRMLEQSDRPKEQVSDR